MSFRSGKFSRDSLASGLKPFCPTFAAMSLEELDLEELRKSGKTLVLLDVDNTLVLWRSEEIPESTMAWIERGKALGLQFCILSNTRRKERLARLAERFGIPYLTGRFKPSPEMYRLAMQRFGAEPFECVMIGDQLLTDVLGANRAGIDAIWVKPLSKHEFIGTRINRVIERVFRAAIYRALEADPSAEPAPSGIPGIFRHRLVRQFIKFCIVGASSTVLDVGLHYLLMFVVTWNGVPVSDLVGTWVLSTFFGETSPSQEAIRNAAFAPLKVPVVVLAILNSFYWNRRWTFRVVGKESRHRQIVKFFVVALIGMGLNVVLSSGLHAVVPGSDKVSWAIATAVATVVVVFWNFTGQRLWTFRKDMA
jgi:HAD superfamily phosphatase (TIGR01668 family)